MPGSSKTRGYEDSFDQQEATSRDYSNPSLSTSSSGGERRSMLEDTQPGCQGSLDTPYIA